MNGMRTYTASEARTHFADIINEAIYGKPVVIQRHKNQVAVVPIAFLERMAELEAFIDSNDAQIALEEFRQRGGRSMEDLEKELGID